MNVVLEGPDNAGKTTLARHLVDASKSGYFHPGGSPKDYAAELECINQQMKLLTASDPVVIDRATCISQQVYSPFQGHGQQLVRKAAMQRLIEHGVLVLYCRPSTDRLMRLSDLTWRPEETEDHKQKILAGQHGFIARYDEVMASVLCLHVNFEDESYSTICRMVKWALQGETSASEWAMNNRIKGSR